MEDLTLDEIRELARESQSPGISIYLPTHRAGAETRQNSVRFKNLLREAEHRLRERGMKPREVSGLLEPAKALLIDTPFWQQQRDGLAVFISPDEFHTYQLPFRVAELLVIARAYYVKPVLPLFTNNGHYYVLALSQDEVRLFEGTRHTIGQIDLPEGTPASLEEALQYDDPEKQLQFHSGTAPGSAPGGRAGMFFGHGPGEEDQKVRIERYFNLVDAALRRVWGHEQTPVVLAGVDYLLPIYRQVSDYPHHMKSGIVGNPEHLRMEELQERAWPIVEPHFRREIEQVLEAYERHAAGNRASDDLEEIVAAAYFGRVDRLVLAADAHVWGRFDRDTGRVLHHQSEQSAEDDVPLVDFAAMQTLQNGGTIYALTQAELPAESPVIAVYRYAE